MNREPQNLLDQSLEEIRELIRERTPMYRDELAYRDLSHARLTERCYVLQDWDPKKFYLKGHFRHVFECQTPTGIWLLRVTVRITKRRISAFTLSSWSFSELR
jgi:hypothetical protein